MNTGGFFEMKQVTVEGHSQTEQKKDEKILVKEEELVENQN